MLFKKPPLRIGGKAYIFKAPCLVTIRRIPSRFIVWFSYASPEHSNVIHVNYASSSRFTWAPSEINQPSN